MLLVPQERRARRSGGLPSLGTGLPPSEPPASFFVFGLKKTQFLVPRKCFGIHLGAVRLIYRNLLSKCAYISERSVPKDEELSAESHSEVFILTKQFHIDRVLVFGARAFK